MFSSERFTYRPLGPDDFDAVHAMMSDWDVVRHLGIWPWPPDPDFTRSRCKPFDGNGFIWAIVEDTSVLGFTGIVDGGLGYSLAQPAWGRGVMTEACIAAIDHHFAQSDSPLKASAWEDNPASCRVLTKLGFTETLRELRFSKPRGVDTPIIDYSLSKMDWNSRTPLRNDAVSGTRDLNTNVKADR